MAALARILERLVDVRSRGLGIAEHPQSILSKDQIIHPWGHAKAPRQGTMFGRIIKRDPLMEMRSCFRDVSP